MSISSVGASTSSSSSVNGLTQTSKQDFQSMLAAAQAQSGKSPARAHHHHKHAGAVPAAANGAASGAAASQDPLSALMALAQQTYSALGGGTGAPSSIPKM